jgi:hypothetical protein
MRQVERVDDVQNWERHKKIGVNSRPPKIKSGAPDRPTHLIFAVLSGSCVKITPIEPRSIRADVPAPAVAEIASTAANIDAAAPASAATPASATETAASEAAATTPSLCRRGRCSDQDGRGADEINEHQSHRCDAARNDIVAFSHFFGISRSIQPPKLKDTTSFRRARSAFGSSGR